MKGFIPLITLSHVADCCPECLSCLIEIISDSSREDYNGQPLIYSREFIEEVRFRRWSRFMNDVRELAFHGILDFKKVGKDVIEVMLLNLEEVPQENDP